ncbi:MAG: hypothetical protein QXX12_04540 [Nanopusillaceae archaeon]
MLIIKITFNNKIEKKFYLTDSFYVEDILHSLGDESLRREIERIVMQEIEDTSFNGHKEKVYKLKLENTDILVKIIKKEDSISNFNIELREKLPPEDKRYLRERVLLSLLRNIKGI